MSLKKFFIFLIFILIAFSQSLSEQPSVSPSKIYYVYINFYDENKIGVENVYFSITYQEFLDNNLVTKTYEGISDINGQAIAQLEFDENASIEKFFILYYYYPLHSSKKVVELSQYKNKIEIDVTLPLNLTTAKINFLENKKGVADVNFWFVRPFLFHKKTSKDGSIIFKLPKGSVVEGWVNYKNSSSFFSFILNQSSSFTISYPFANSSNLEFSEIYNLTKLQISSTNKKAYALKPLIVSANNINSTYFTDELGFIYILNSPTQNLEVFYFYADQALSNRLNLSNNSFFRLFIPTLLQFQKPNITYLGESCYNVQLKITEPRKGVIQKVYAKSIDSNDSYIFTLEQNQVVDEKELIFYKIFCVANNTFFDVYAQSPYENASIRIELLKPPAEPSPPSNIQDDIPSSLKEKLKQAQTTELLILLGEILVLLLVAFVFVKFKTQVYFIVQSILRFFYVSFKKKKEE
ncbi:MAG: hypothetical protein QXV83_01400 [Candidatus Anstonellaceae archaeon]